MKELLLLAGATVAALPVIAASVGPGGDSTTLVSPPEVVAEEFVRHLAAGRYDRAVNHLADDAGAGAMLPLVGRNLRERAGEVHQVEGGAGAVDGDIATASTRITTSDAGEIEWELSLVRRRGTWKITDWTTGPR